MGTRWTDEEGRDWNCRVSIDEANRLRSEDGLDLLDPECVTRIWSDPFQVVMLLTCVHRKQWTERGLSAGDFAEVCTYSESVAAAAHDALTAALTDFFRRLRKPALADVVERAATAAKTAEDRAQAILSERGQAVIERAVSKATQSVEDAIAKALE